MQTKPLPMLNPGTKQPLKPEEMEGLFAKGLVEQEFSQERFIEIPDEVWQLYKIYRPTPLVRASGLEKALDTPAKIYFKNESVSPVGSHKLNSAIPQAYYNKIQGIKHITTETGAGQWGSAMETHLIQSKIYTIRGQKVMLDFDLAALYDTETKRLKESVKRNGKRFPPDFMFELTNTEWQSLRSQFATSNRGGRRYLPYAFTEQGVAMETGIQLVITRFFVCTKFPECFRLFQFNLIPDKFILRCLFKI